MSGEWIDPKKLVPGQVDPEKEQLAKIRQMEKQMDKKAKRSEQWQASES